MSAARNFKIDDPRDESELLIAAKWGDFKRSEIPADVLAAARAGRMPRMYVEPPKAKPVKVVKVIKAEPIEAPAVAIVRPLQMPPPEEVPKTAREAMADYWESRRCFQCKGLGFCSHREQEVALAEADWRMKWTR